MAAVNKILVFGVFDLLHPGHKHFLKQASQLGDRLYVILAHDKSVWKNKKRLPVQSTQVRRHNLQKLPFIYKVIIGQSHSRKHHLSVLKVKPNIIALGYDQTCLIPKLKKTLVKEKLIAKIIKLKPYHPHLYKTSKYLKAS